MSTAYRLKTPLRSELNTTRWPQAEKAGCRSISQSPVRPRRLRTKTTRPPSGETSGERARRPSVRRSTRPLSRSRAYRSLANQDGKVQRSGDGERAFTVGDEGQGKGKSVCFQAWARTRAGERERE